MTTTLELSASSSDSSTRRALSDISLGVAKSKRIIVVTGAGISCSSGIPDFRSSDGLYALVKQQYPDVVIKGRDLFDASLFRDSTSTAVFYTFISQLKQSSDRAEPTPTHHFIKTLDSKSKLLRSYTQNIDGLEERAGLLGSSSSEAKTTGKGKSKIKTKEVRSVQLHGDLNRVRCTFCSAEFPCEPEHLDLFDAGIPPDCSECAARSKARVARSARPLKIGTLRPAIVLYDEPHPLGDEIGLIQTSDLGRKPDMLIIMGTSLKVHGLKKLVKDFARAVHASPSTSKASTPKVVFVNRTPPGAEWANIIDYHVKGETDAWVGKVLQDWKKARPADWEVQQTLDASLGDISVSLRPIASGSKPKVAPKKKHVQVADDQPSRELENIRPINSFFSSPMAASSTPISPSKRRKSTSHYDDVESSPSKKRIAQATVGLGNMSLDIKERGMLFGGKEGGNKTIADVSMTDASMRSMADASMRSPDESLLLGDASLMALDEEVVEETEDAFWISPPKPTTARKTAPTKRTPPGPAAPAKPRPVEKLKVKQTTTKPKVASNPMPVTLKPVVGSSATTTTTLPFLATRVTRSKTSTRGKKPTGIVKRAPIPKVPAAKRVVSVA